MGSVRDFVIDGDVAHVALTKGHVATVDVEDVPMLEGVCWTAEVRKHTVYANRKMVVDGKTRTIYMHRLIMGEPCGLEVDHKDNNGLNNRRSNLRNATRVQNAINVKIPDSNKTGTKGVCWDAGRGKWLAYIKVGGKRKHLGRFDNFEIAKAAYLEASEVYHGEFARL